jgi:NAD+ synthase
MLNVVLSQEQVDMEIKRITDFIAEYLNGHDKVVVGVSGGLDSDVVARLAAKTPGVKQIKLFTMLQKDMDPRHLANARALAEDLKADLVEIELPDAPFTIMKALYEADKNEEFRPEGLDAMRMKCSIRTAIFSSYQDHGFIVLGTSNRTEYEAGFYLPFGDGISHVKPIIHLYKTQVRQLAAALGTQSPVLDQPASAGFWLGEEDLDDMAWWLYNEGPIAKEIDFSEEDDIKVAKIHAELTTEKVDMVLSGISKGIDDNAIANETGISLEVIGLFHKLLADADRFKHRPINASIQVHN